VPSNDLQRLTGHAARCALVALVLLAVLVRPGHGEILNGRAYYPEGPLWFADGLLYTEMTADRVVRWEAGRNRVLWYRRGCGPTSIATWRGGLLVTCHLSAQLVRLDPTGLLIEIISADSGGNPIPWPNDSAADDSGGVYVSSSGVFDPAAPATGKIFYAASDGVIRKVAEGLRYANGVLFLRDPRRLLVSEHLAGKVLRYLAGTDGGLVPDGIFADLARQAPPPAGAPDYAGPDGLDVDRAGNVYVSQYGAGRIVVLSPAGKFVRAIAVPESHVTNLTFDRAGNLYVTAPGALRPPGIGKVYRFDRPR